MPLPATALGITAHNGVLSVADADEMLARYEDQGRTWQMIHFKRGGELLSSGAFAGHDGWAMRSFGGELHSHDGGTPWKQIVKAPESVMRLVAADTQHLMANRSQGFLVSSNGGKTWQMVESARNLWRKGGASPALPGWRQR